MNMPESEPISWSDIRHHAGDMSDDIFNPVVVRTRDGKYHIVEAIIKDEDLGGDILLAGPLNL